MDSALAKQSSYAQLSKCLPDTYAYVTYVVRQELGAKEREGVSFTYVVGIG